MSLELHQAGLQCHGLPEGLTVNAFGLAAGMPPGSGGGGSSFR
ncbi:MAG TPA: hypothetical protein VGP70_23565 [Actinomadura sp.]|nr:hypothetical protein [Actinomadura sp.]